MIKITKEMIMEEIIRGRALDHYTTLASRETINAIKDETVREAFNTNGRVDFALDVPEITDDIDYLRGIIIRLREGDSVVSDGSYEFDLDASDEERQTSDIYVNITLPRRYEEDYSFEGNIPPRVGTQFPEHRRANGCTASSPRSRGVERFADCGELLSVWCRGEGSCSRHL